jgi:propionyl-CoA carboxylase alpha chain
MTAPSPAPAADPAAITTPAASATTPHPVTPIHTLLVANRGEIARRIMRTARAMGMTTVAVYSDADADSPHAQEADLAVRLPGDAPADTYLRSALILDAASRAGADAIHPGYGFLSESGDFARVVVGAGFTWVGPPPAAIDAMGSKIGSKELMRGAGVPTLPSLTITVTDEGEELPEDAELEALGWPLLVKASAGGGGRGMRIVGGPVSLREAVASARREAEAAFGDGTVFLERYVPDPRHIEVQVLADTHGHTVALFERECSIQRRHQKIIEEAPSPVVTPALRTRLTEAAVAAAEAVGYVNAGTVEFVLDGRGDPYFLEMNTRLQVEHPVTEAVTGLDLVRLQLLIAGGAPLPDEVLDAVAAGPQGHAIEARLYAEDPADAWLPSTGTLHRFEVGGSVSAQLERSVPIDSTVQLDNLVRVDSGVESGSVVSPHYDPMLAKVIVHAPTRTEAAAALASTLARARIHGVTTNRALLVHTLRHAAFVAGATDTGFLDRHGLKLLATPLTAPEGVGRHALAAALSAQARRRAQAAVQSAVPSGFRNNADAPQEVRYRHGSGSGGSSGSSGSSGALIVVGYRFDRFGRGLVEATIDGESIDVDEATVAEGSVVLATDGVTRHYRVEQFEDWAYVDGPDGSSALAEEERFPSAVEQLREGSALAPMPGGVVRVTVSVGDTVSAGQLLVVLEAMKMEHAVHATAAGTVTEVTVAEGDQVETGRVLVVVEAPTDADTDGAGRPDPTP